MTSKPLRTITAKIIFSPVFRNRLNLSQCTISLEKDKCSLKDLLYRVSEETHGRIDALLFEKGNDRILSGLMVQVNDQRYTGTTLNQKQISLNGLVLISEPFNGVLVSQASPG